jgi:Rrf2 family protein
MKISAQEEYGLRCLMHLVRCGQNESLTIPEISRAEGLSVPNVAKLMRLLRMGGLVQSARGQSGGYMLAHPPDKITVASVLELLGGQFFNPDFCQRHTGRERRCTHSSNCSLRSLWRTVQLVLAEVLEKTTLDDLLCSEKEMTARIESMTGVVLPSYTVQRVRGAYRQSH